VAVFVVMIGVVVVVVVVVAVCWSLEPKSPQLTVVVLLTGFFSWSGEFAPTQLPFACDVGFTSFILSPLASFKLGFDDERERDILALGLEKGDLLLFFFKMEENEEGLELGGGGLEMKTEGEKDEEEKVEEEREEEDGESGDCGEERVWGEYGDRDRGDDRDCGDRGDDRDCGDRGENEIGECGDCGEGDEGDEGGDEKR